MARARGVVDFATPDLASGLRRCNLLVLATPVRSILKLLSELPTISNPQSLISILDLGSTKSEVVAAMEALPEEFDPIGGHPMCGREVSGLEHADGTLFHDQTFVLVPLRRTTPQALALARQVVSAVGARALELTPEQHDALTAVSSHLPYAAATALMRAALSLGDEQVWRVAASGFRDTSRLAASDLTMMVDILITNRQALLQALGRYRAELDTLASLIEAGDASALRAALAPAQARRAQLFRG
jgi:prephenate dehydrogenase